MLKIRNITKSYPQRGEVLKELSLEMNAGETVAITGPSGSGKTTLLNIIGVLDLPDSGEIRFRGESLSGLTADQSACFRRDNIGFVFQDHLLLPHLKIIDNILLPILADKSQKNNLDHYLKYADKLLGETGIAEIKHKYPHQVSGGEAQRATLVRALINKPALLLADEPTGSLDRDNAEELGKLLLQVNREYNTAILTVTHADDLARKMMRSLSLVNGKLV